MVASLVATDLGDASVDLVQQAAERLAPAVHEAGERLARAGLAFDRHDGGEVDLLRDPVELEAPSRDLLDLRPLLRVLDEDDRRVRVNEDVAALGGQVRLVDRNRDRAAGEDREVDFHPFRTRPGEDRDPIARLEAELDEAGGDRPDALRHPLPRHVVPAVRGPMPVSAVYFPPHIEARPPGHAGERKCIYSGRY